MTKKSRLGLPSEYDYWLAEYSPIIPQKSITTSVYVSLVAAWWRNEVIWYWHLASPMWRKCSPNTIQYIVDMNLIWKMIWQIICMICKIICNDNDNEKLICSYIEYWNKFLLKVYYFGPTPPPFLRKKVGFENLLKVICLVQGLPYKSLQFVFEENHIALPSQSVTGGCCTQIMPIPCLHCVHNHNTIHCIQYLVIYNYNICVCTASWSIAKCCMLHWNVNGLLRNVL